MIGQILVKFKAQSALVAEEGLLRGMHLSVSHALGFGGEETATDVTGERPLACVYALVDRERLSVPEGLVAVGALVRPLIRVHALMQVELIDRSEGLGTLRTLARLLAGVDAPMGVTRRLGCERRTAEVAGKTLDLFVHGADMIFEVLLDAVRLAAQMTDERTHVRVNTQVPPKNAALCHYLLAHRTAEELHALDKDPAAGDDAVLTRRHLLVRLQVPDQLALGQVGLQADVALVADRTECFAAVRRGAVDFAQVQHKLRLEVE